MAGGDCWPRIECRLNPPPPGNEGPVGRGGQLAVRVSGTFFFQRIPKGVRPAGSRWLGKGCWLAGPPPPPPPPVMEALRHSKKKKGRTAFGELRGNGAGNTGWGPRRERLQTALLLCGLPTQPETKYYKDGERMHTSHEACRTSRKKWVGQYGGE